MRRLEAQKIEDEKFRSLEDEGKEIGGPRLNPLRSSSAKNLTGQAEDGKGEKVRRSEKQKIGRQER